jgi:hypothetical protein
MELRERPAPRIERPAEVDELEALWRAPAAAPPRRAAGHLYRSLWWMLIAGWPAALLFLIAAAPESNAPAPLWADALAGIFFFALLAAPFLGHLGGGLGVIAATVAGGIGIALGVACRATEHHVGSWWMVETGMFATLTAVGLACLAARRR